MRVQGPAAESLACFGTRLDASDATRRSPTCHQHADDRRATSATPIHAPNSPPNFRPRVLVIDNYDSFTYNLVQYLGELGAEVETVRNDRATVDELLEQGYARCVVSPGPCTPDQAGITLEAVRRMPRAGVPTLGVCLGHQALAQAFGGRWKLHAPVHGKATQIEHDGRTIFRGLSSPLTVGRYHSLVVDSEKLPDCLEESARGGGVLMGLRHRELPAEGVQFHPESVLTEQGRELLANFLDVARPVTASTGPTVAGPAHLPSDGSLSEIVS